MEQRLGRGLDSLIARTAPADPDAAGLMRVALDQIKVNPQQPRRHIAEEALAGLAASVRRHGVLQPVIVRRQGAGYELVAGERRFRASRIAGLSEIPAVIVSVKGQKSLELALIENIQREDISALDEAEAYRQLLARSGSTHQELADQLGKSRTSITNALRLLDLPEEIQVMMESGGITAGVGRALLGLSSPAEMISAAIRAGREDWSVREAERQVRGTRPKRVRRTKEHENDKKTAYYTEKLMNLYDTKVSIHQRGISGHVRLEFHSREDRDRLIHQLLTGRDDLGDG